MTRQTQSKLKSNQVDTLFTVDFQENHVDVVVVVHAGTIGASLLVALQNNAKYKRFSGGNV